MHTPSPHMNARVYWLLGLALALLLLPLAMRAGDKEDKEQAEREARLQAYQQILNSSRPENRDNGNEPQDVDKMFGADKDSTQRQRADKAMKDKQDRLARFDDQNAATVDHALNGLAEDNGGNQNRHKGRLREVREQREKLIEMFDGRILLTVPYEGRRDFLGKIVLDDVLKAYALAKVELSVDDLIKAEEICSDVASNTPIGGVEPMFRRMRVTAAAEVATKVLTLDERKTYSAFRQGDAPAKDKDKKKKK